MANLWHLSFILLPHALLHQALAYDAPSRWGQATVVINDALFIFGGKTDQYNEFSYTSAPNDNDILFLSLSEPFSASAPPWQLVSSSTNSSTSQGPALAWSTLSAFNTSDILLFGGQPGPNSQTVVTDAADSAQILDVFSRLEPRWDSEPESWAGEPVRRMRHSSVTALSGLVFIFGGEKVDLSNNAFSDHYVFDPRTPSFSLIPSDNGPPDLYGHTSIILSDERILVFGGFSQSSGSLLPLSTIWVLDTTQSTLSWIVITTNTTNLPSPRMAFAAVLISGGKIVIHGGTDANFQTNFDDGWILDTTQNPMTWNPVDALSQVGARRDHFAVSSGNQVIFGFGYGNSGPAPAPLQIFNPSDNTFSPTFNPPSPGSPITQTLPGPSQTTTKSTSTPHTSGGVHPTSTVDPTNPGGDGKPDNSSSNTTSIAVGTAFGIMSLLIVGLGTGYYVRRRNRNNEGDRQFMALDAEDDDGSDSPHFEGQIPVAGVQHEMGETHGVRGILGTLGIGSAAAKMRTHRNHQPLRRDILADEDNQSLAEWYKARKKDSSGGSSWSLMSIFGVGTPRLRSREASMTGHSTPRREKSDPFSDGAGSMRDEETGFIGAAYLGSRPRARRELSYASSRSAMSYRDPFVDPIEEETRPEFSPTELYTECSDSGLPPRPTVRQVQPSSLPAIKTVLPLSQQVNQPMSPLSERTSQSTLGLQYLSGSGSSQAHSSENVPSPFATVSQATSLTSIHPASPSSPTKTTSIIGASDPSLLQTNQPMRRSDSWWSRFSRSSLMDRRASESGRTIFDIRDPNPAPRLGAIEEGSLNSAPTERSSPSSASRQQSANSAAPIQRQASNSDRLYNTAGHGKSMSSLRTADSEAIERMAGTMDVVQRVKSRNSRWGSGSTSSAGGLSIDTQGSVSEVGENQNILISNAEGGEDPMLFMSPDEEQSTPSAGLSGQVPSSPPSAFKATFVPVGPLHLDGGSTPLSPGKVSERIQAYERRMSQDQTSPLPTNSKQKEERSKKRVEVDYGLVPRRSLFVANPDNRAPSRSTDS